MIITSLGFGRAWLLILAGFVLLVPGLLIKGFQARLISDKHSACSQAECLLLSYF